jgi:hypothetical protein
MLVVADQNQGNLEPFYDTAAACDTIGTYEPLRLSRTMHAIINIRFR